MRPVLPTIVMIGFMGAGKTSTGRLVARSLGREFVDTDSLVERAARAEIAEIFRREGEEGSGGGFGVNARPVGMYVIRGEQVSWQPAVDVTRIVLGGQLLLAAALLVIRSIVRSRARSR